MNTTLTKWGNSVAIRLPKAFITQIGAKEGDIVDIKIQQNEIVVSKSNPSLEDLLSKVTPENLHNETNTGNITGKEIW